jgi:hypothetical protein
VSREESRDSTWPSDRFAGGYSNRPTRAARDFPRRGALYFNGSTCSPAPPSSLARRGKSRRRLDLSIAAPLTLAVFSLHYSSLLTLPVCFPIHRFSSFLPISIFHYRPYQPSPLSLPDFYFLPPLINPRHYLFPIFSPYHLLLSSLSIIASRSPCRPTLSHHALRNIV